ncbi:HNH endonuclease [Paenibacillus sp. NEAU-GSW1]|uniref:HNH endonuclease n=1 Tax=Paenibacillus sp. NEAU-GSW1 TaxID=2682486 RepID=UPI0012E1B46E|nr:HNH endonuclease [Paenibacillus sp. NEAU-GSW1]MUT66152.1 EVE domain-containing protein [Paenibacillus sp. NEAU-GSW1]
MQNNDSMIGHISKSNIAWIFQWVPADYNTFDDFKMGKKTELWRANQHFSKMKAGDIALLWKAGSGTEEQAGEAGIYGLARLMGEPFPAPLSDKYAKYRVKLEYFFLLTNPILKSTLAVHPQLNELSQRIVRGTNFRVTEEEWIELRSIILGEEAVIQQDRIPERKLFEGMRFVRDSQMVSRIKDAVDHKCQICGLQIKTKGDGYYSEGHHIQPLGNDHEGPDEEGNIIILCPNHHQEFDLGVIAIEPLRQIIVHWDTNNPYHSKNLAYSRKLKKEFLEYHYTTIFMSK